MGIDYRALRGLTARELVNALLRDGFVFDRQRGGHQLYYHPDDRRRVTVSFHHAGQTYPVKTLKSMLEEQARWNEDDLRRLKLVR
jgi:predicted RNA binding protein YcfA (HicA-like mRNA interferase family)